ncbi:MAG: class I SAM-dependent methyltransferase [Candidatus Hodarchaeales archaeon]
MQASHLEFLDKIYLQQMSWTKQTRKYLFRKMNLFHSKNILEVGSGTGRLLQEINAFNPKIKPIGLDIDYFSLDFMLKNNRIDLPVINASGETLPFSDNLFDITICNWLLLWLKKPFLVLKEMVRVTREGGWIACLAEPDYAGRLDYPFDISLKNLFLESLSAPDPNVGKKLPYLFSKLGLQAQAGLQSSVIQGQDAHNLYDHEFRLLNHLLPKKRAILKRLREQLNLLSDDPPFLYMPVYYAIARK